MIYSNNFADGGITLESDLSVHPVYGQFEIAQEAMEVEHDVFMKIMDQDFAECYNKYNPNMVSESNLQAVQEASIGEIFKKVKEFIIKAGKKLLGILDNILTKIKMLCTKDGATLVSKYGKRARANYNSGKMSEVKFKWRKSLNWDIPGLGGKFANEFKNIESEMNAADKGGYNTYGIKDERKLSDVSDKEKDAVKPYTEDEKRDFKEALYGHLCGSSSEDEKSFRDELMSKFLDDEETIEGSKFDLAEAEGILKGHNKDIKAVNTNKKTVETIVKEYRKAAEDIEKKHTKALSEKDATFMNKVANTCAGKIIALCNIWSTCYSKAFAVQLESLKIKYKYAKSGFVKCATYGGKSEAAFEENFVLEEEISNYEVDVLLS